MRKAQFTCSRSRWSRLAISMCPSRLNHWFRNCEIARAAKQRTGWIAIIHMGAVGLSWLSG